MAIVTAMFAVGGGVLANESVIPAQGLDPDVYILIGTGDPNADLNLQFNTAILRGSLFLRSDGGAGTSLYVKTGNTTWTAK